MAALDDGMMTTRIRTPSQSRENLHPIHRSVSPLGGKIDVARTGNGGGIKRGRVQRRDSSDHHPPVKYSTLNNMGAAITYERGAAITYEASLSHIWHIPSN